MACQKEMQAAGAVEVAAAATSAPAAPEAASAAPTLELRSVSCGYAGAPVLSDVSLSLSGASSLVILGPNGVGKTTLFKTVLGLLPKLAGQVLLGGQDVSGWTRKRYARFAAYVPQTVESAFGFSVFEQVLMGRTPLIEGLASPSAEDERVAHEVIAELGLESIEDRDCTTLSGGELQMMLIARALAQKPRLLVMDEPCANLDIGNQVLVLKRIRRLVSEGLSVVMTSHDPNHALLLGGQVACIFSNGEVQSGQAGELLSPELLARLYGAPVGLGEVSDGAGLSGPACAPLLDADDAAATAAAAAGAAASNKACSASPDAAGRA